MFEKTCELIQAMAESEFWGKEIRDKAEESDAELNQIETELTRIRAEVDRLTPLAELGEAFEYAVQNEVRFIRQMSNGERLAFVDKYDKAKLLKIFNEILEENKSMKACIYRCQEQGGEFNE